MEFNEKLQELRRQRNLTQEELAEILFVSRTAVSKWESGRGMPNIESLKAIANFFSVTVDDLLSGEQILVIAEDDRKQKEMRTRDLIYGALDCSMALLLWLPFFGQKAGGAIEEVSLVALTEIQPYVKLLYLAVVMGMAAFGAITPVLQNCKCLFWAKNKSKISLLINTAGVLLFIIGQQPYAAVFAFAFLIIKALMFIKVR